MQPPQAPQLLCWWRAHLGGLPGLCAGVGPLGVPRGLPKPARKAPMPPDPCLLAGTLCGGPRSGTLRMFSELLRLTCAWAAAGGCAGAGEGAAAGAKLASPPKDSRS